MCVDGQCVCNPGLAACGSPAACVDTQIDASNCGSCGKSCEATQVCTGAKCTCPNAGEAYCASAGGCIDVQSDDENCGICGKACAAPSHCTAGKCACASAGELLCGGACVDVKSDPAHCGTCTKVCAGGQACAAGVCGCPAPPTSDEIQVTTTAADSAHPAAAWDGNHFGLVYLEGVEQADATPFEGNLFFTLLNPDGSRALAQDIALTSHPPGDPTSIASPRIVWTGVEYGVLWVENSGASSAIFLLRLSGTGAPLAPAVNVTAATAAQKASTDSPDLAFSPAVAGYALASVSATATPSIDFQGLGATGAAPQARIQIPIEDPGSPGHTPPQLGVDAQGAWGVLSHFSTWVQLSSLTPNGVYSGKHVVVSKSATGEVALGHDGVNWLSAWLTVPAASGGVLPDSVSYRRGGFGPSTTGLVPTGGSGSFRFGDVVLAFDPTGVLTFAWTEHSGGAGPYVFSARRFVNESFSSMPYQPIGDVVSLLSTSTIAAPQQVTLASGGGHVIGVWADSRLGAEELYSRSFEVTGCK
jgi:hypothetical protein